MEPGSHSGFRSRRVDGGDLCQPFAVVTRVNHRECAGWAGRHDQRDRELSRLSPGNWRDGAHAVDAAAGRAVRHRGRLRRRRRARARRSGEARQARQRRGRRGQRDHLRDRLGLPQARAARGRDTLGSRPLVVRDLRRLLLQAEDDRGRRRRRGQPHASCSR